VKREDAATAQTSDPLALYQQAVARAAEQVKRAAEAQALAQQEQVAAALRQAAEQIRAVLPEAVWAQGWTVERMPNCSINSVVRLRPTFLPEDVGPLDLRVSLADDRRGLHIENREGYYLNSDDPDRVVAALGSLILRHIADQRQYRADEARERAQQVEDAAHAARIEALLDDMAADFARGADLELSRIQQTHGWPVGRSLFVYRLQWVQGVSSDGMVEEDRTWVRYAQPGPDGFYDVLTTRGIVRQKIIAPVMRLTEVEWRSVEELPHAGFKETVVRTRALRVYTADHEGRISSARRWSQREALASLVLPGPVVRGLLGLDVGPVPEDGRPPSASAGYPLIAVGLLPDGTTVPYDPDKAEARA
jgi:hypothetical protein